MRHYKPYEANYEGDNEYTTGASIKEFVTEDARVHSRGPWESTVRKMYDKKIIAEHLTDSEEILTHHEYAYTVSYGDNEAGFSVSYLTDENDNLYGVSVNEVGLQDIYAFSAAIEVARRTHIAYLRELVPGTRS